MSKGHALAAVRTIAEHLPVAVEDPSDLRAIFVSESTVKFHVRNIMGKLDVHQRAEVAYVASRLGLLEHA